MPTSHVSWGLTAELLTPAMLQEISKSNASRQRQIAVTAHLASKLILFAFARQIEDEGRATAMAGMPHPLCNLTSLVNRARLNQCLLVLAKGKQVHPVNGESEHLVHTGKQG